MTAPQQGRTPPSPDFVLTVDGRNITPLVDPRLVSLTLTECRGGEADQLDLVLSDHDGQLAMPRKGALIALQLGWKGQPLIDKGTFKVDEAEHSGAPDVVCIRARSADLKAEMRVRVEKSWHDTTVGAIVREIAGKHGLAVKLDEVLAQQAVEHIDQTHESDVHFLTRLAARYDAVATVKKGTLVFGAIDRMTLASVTITRRDGDQHRFHTSDREAYSGVRAYWHDPKQAKRRGVLVGTSGNAKRLRDTHGSEEDALAAARGEWGRLKRGTASLELSLATGMPELAPQMPIRAEKMKSTISARQWIALRVIHRVSDNGLETDLLAEEHSPLSLP